MRITQWGEFGILCTIYIAHRHAQGDKIISAADIAESQGIAVEYAQQILLRLRRGGVIESVRGPQGGYHLLGNPENITLQEILRAVEGDTFEVICETKPIHPEICNSGGCGLRTVWEALRNHINVFFRQYTVARMLELLYPPEQVVHIESAVR